MKDSSEMLCLCNHYPYNWLQIQELNRSLANLTTLQFQTFNFIQFHTDISDPTEEFYDPTTGNYNSIYVRQQIYYIQTNES